MVLVCFGLVCFEPDYLFWIVMIGKYEIEKYVYPKPILIDYSDDFDKFRDGWGWLTSNP